VFSNSVHEVPYRPRMRLIRFPIVLTFEFAEQMKLTRHSQGCCLSIRSPRDWLYLVSKNRSGEPLYAMICSLMDSIISEMGSDNPKNRMTSCCDNPSYSMRMPFCLIVTILPLCTPFHVSLVFFHPNICPHESERSRSKGSCDSVSEKDFTKEHMSA